MAGFIQVPPPPGLPALPPPPSPGQVAGAVEDFITGGLRGAIDAVRTAAGASAANPDATTTIVDPRTGQRSEYAGVVSREEFAAFSRQVSEAFGHVAADIAAINSQGAGGGMYGSAGGGMGGMDPLLLVLLLGGTLGTGTGALDTTTLLVLMMSGGFGGGGAGGIDPIVMLLLLGVL